MGLTVHWNIDFKGQDARKAVEAVRKRALDLPFEKVGEIVHLKGKDCVFKRGSDDPLGWLKIQGGAHVDDPKYKGHSYSVDAKEIIGFEVFVAPGCESLEFTVCQYPKFVTLKRPIGPSRRIMVNMPGWSGHGFCKTQYANENGIANFLRAHIGVVTLLEFAGTLPGRTVKVSDEGKWGTSHYSDDYKEAYAAGREPTYVDHPANHNVEALVREIGEWDNMIAAFAGALKDAAGKGNIQAPILARKDFEQLEMKGLQKLDGEGLGKFLNQCRDMAKAQVDARPKG